LAISAQAVGFPFRSSFWGTEPVDDWSYTGSTGPEHWGSLAPSYETCGSGESQSPIDIRDVAPDRVPHLSFSYRSGVMSIDNTGHMIRVNFDPGSYLRVGPQRYELKQLHFHVPSEHRVGGIAADLEIHLVHEDALGAKAIVAVPFKAGVRRNSTLFRIGEHIPERPGDYFLDRQLGLNATFLLPPDKSYFTYQGSLTVPPCTEDVRWFVLKHPMEVDSAFIDRLLRAVGPNARPLQRRNGRVVIEDVR